ncbi:hypothetical protein HZA33_05235 [Candidatus Pacearchaeota archaeon]|nr:hypothetical protein [Candidatus Pacearchaeota archaeon]
MPQKNQRKQGLLGLLLGGPFFSKTYQESLPQKIGDYSLILTVPAKGDFTDLLEPIIEGVRLNTTIPVDNIEETLSLVNERASGKDVWVDLKCRQLRIKEYSVKILNDGEIHYVRLSHKIKVNLPTELWIDDGNFTGQIEDIVNQDTLVIPGSVERRKGLPLASQGEVGIRPSMSVNILDPSLKIDGHFTDNDVKYLEAMKKLGMNKVFISYTKKLSDYEDVWKIHSEAVIIGKPEDKEGMDFVRNDYQKLKAKNKEIGLMLPRGDLYVELDAPHLIIGAMKEIIRAEPNAIAASRIFGSLKDIEKMPACNDLTDIAYLMSLGYKRFMLGDDICLNKNTVKSATGLFKAIAQEYQK